EEDGRQLIVPVLVVTEVTCLIGSRLGARRDGILGRPCVRGVRYRPGRPIGLDTYRGARLALSGPAPGSRGCVRDPVRRTIGRTRAGNAGPSAFLRGTSCPRRGLRGHPLTRPRHVK